LLLLIIERVWGLILIKNLVLLLGSDYIGIGIGILISIKLLLIC